MQLINGDFVLLIKQIFTVIKPINSVYTVKGKSIWLLHQNTYTLMITLTVYLQCWNFQKRIILRCFFLLLTILFNSFSSLSCYVLVPAVSLSVRAGPCVVSGRPCQTAIGHSGWRTGQSCRQRASGRWEVKPRL